MRKIFIPTCMLLLSAALPVMGTESLEIMIDHAPITFEDSAAYMNEEGNILLPIRAVSEYFGYAVDWNGDTNSVRISTTDIEILLYVNETSYEKNGERNELSIPVENNDGRTYIEYIDLISMFNNGYMVQYDDESGLVNIFQGNEFTVTADGVADWRGNILSDEELAEMGVSEKFIEHFKSSVEKLNE